MVGLIEVLQHKANGRVNSEDKHGPRETAALDNTTDEAKEGNKALGADGEAQAEEEE